MLEKRTCDLAIIGGGLAGGLIALALRRQRPELELLLIESGETFGGNHIWSYFSTDVAPEHRWLTAPLVTHGWSGHEVRFPGHNRTLPDIYYSIESDRFDQVIREQLPERMRVTGVEVASVTPTAIALKGHGRIRAGGVIDCRGPADTQALDCGWQKFVGQLVELEQPHGLTHPIIMDATVEQKDGYRFVYCLPFTPTSMFVEDTYYSDKPDLDRRRIAQRIGEYVDAQGWTISRTLREETGVLPVVHGGSLANYWKAGGERTAKAGARAALFHIDIDDVSITHLNFSREYSAAVEAKQVAQQDSEKAKFIVDRAMQEKKSIVIRAEGEAESARLISSAIQDNPGFLQMRRIDAAKEIAETVSQSSNKVYLNADTLLLNLLEDMDETSLKGAKKSGGWGK